MEQETSKHRNTSTTPQQHERKYKFSINASYREIKKWENERVWECVLKTRRRRRTKKKVIENKSLRDGIKLEQASNTIQKEKFFF